MLTHNYFTVHIHLRKPILLFFPITDSPCGEISDSGVLIFYLLKHIKMLDQKVSNNQIDHGWLDQSEI